MGYRSASADSGSVRGGRMTLRESLKKHPLNSGDTLVIRPDWEKLMRSKTHKHIIGRFTKTPIDNNDTFDRAALVEADVYVSLSEPSQEGLVPSSWARSYLLFRFDYSLDGEAQIVGVVSSNRGNPNYKKIYDINIEFLNQMCDIYIANGL
jgi:hypothetical protein